MPFFRASAETRLKQGTSSQPFFLGAIMGARIRWIFQILIDFAE
jgi:hypothetical protein